MLYLSLPVTMVFWLLISESVVGAANLPQPLPTMAVPQSGWADLHGRSATGALVDDFVSMGGAAPARSSEMENAQTPEGAALQAVGDPFEGNDLELELQQQRQLMTRHSFNYSLQGSCASFEMPRQDKLLGMPQAFPEPATVTALTAGVFGLAIYWRRARRNLRAPSRATAG